MTETEQNDLPFISQKQIDVFLESRIPPARLREFNYKRRKKFEEDLKNFIGSFVAEALTQERRRGRTSEDHKRLKRQRRINVVLFGQTGSGKSTAGNLILGREVFPTDAGMGSCTMSVECGEIETEEGTVVRVVDTPGFLGGDMTKILRICPEGVHIFLFVFKLGSLRFTHQQMEMFMEIEENFGGNLSRHCAGLLTNGKSLLERGSSLEKYLKENADTNIGQLLLDTFGGRVMAVDGNGPKGELELQTRQVHSFIHSIVDSLGYQPFNADLASIQELANAINSRV